MGRVPEKTPRLGEKGLALTACGDVLIMRPAERHLRRQPRMTVDSIDITLSLILAYFAWRGWRRGLVATLASLVAPVAAFVAAGRYGPDAAVLLADYVTAPASFLKVLGYGLTFIGVAAGLRLAAGALAMALGLKDSLFFKGTGAIAGAGSAALLMGAAILVLHSFAPERDEDPGAGGLLTNRAHSTIGRASERMEQTWLGPRLAALTESAVAQVLEEPEADAARLLQQAAGGGVTAETQEPDASDVSPPPYEAAPRRALGVDRLRPAAGDVAREDAAAQ